MTHAKTLHQLIRLKRSPIQRLGAWWRKIFPAHDWKDTSIGDVESRTCAICGKRQVSELDEFNEIWSTIDSGDRSKH